MSSGEVAARKLPLPYLDGTRPGRRDEEADKEEPRTPQERQKERHMEHTIISLATSIITGAITYAAVTHIQEAAYRRRLNAALDEQLRQVHAQVKEALDRK